MAGPEKAEHFPESEMKFSLKIVDAGIEFVLDVRGNVKGIVLHQRDQKMTAKKTK